MLFLCYNYKVNNFINYWTSRSPRPISLGQKPIQTSLSREIWTIKRTSMKIITSIVFTFLFVVGFSIAVATTASAQGFNPDNVEHLRLKDRGSVNGSMALYHALERAGESRYTVGDYREFEIRFISGLSAKGDTDKVYKAAIAELKAVGVKPLVLSKNGLVIGFDYNLTDCAIVQQVEQSAIILNKHFPQKRRVVQEFILRPNPVGGYEEVMCVE